MGRTPGEAKKEKPVKAAKPKKEKKATTAPAKKET
jgi:hypothetical protein